MQASQLQRDQARLRSKKVSLRKKERIVPAHVAAKVHGVEAISLSR
jgi:hypothetical protein